MYPALSCCWLGCQMRVATRPSLSLISRQSNRRRHPDDTRPFCKATRDLTTSAETFVRYKEYIRRSDDMFSKDTLIEMRELVEQYRNEIEDDALEIEAALQGAPEWQRPIIAFFAEVSEWTRNASKKGQELIENDRPIGYSELLDEMKDLLTPRLRGFAAAGSILINAGADTIYTLLLILVYGFVLPNQMENLRFPEGDWGLTWILWSAPFAAVTALVWRVGLDETRRPLKGFRIAEENLWFSIELLRAPESYNNTLLLIKSGEKAWSTTVKFQGLALGLLQSLWASTVVGQDYAMTGFSMEGPVPSLLRLPVEILFLSSFAGFIALIRDKSLLLSSEQVMAKNLPGKLFRADPRVQVKTLEEFELLNDTKITKERIWFTFVYTFLTTGYLTIEALSMRSLYTAMGTLFVSYFIMFKSMQRKDF